MPPASFELLLTTLATEALVALGQVPHPITGKTQAQRNQAKFLIDTVDVLRQKTAGNLTNSEQQVIDSLLYRHWTEWRHGKRSHNAPRPAARFPEEQQVLDSLLHQMRLVFVQTADLPTGSQN